MTEAPIALHELSFVPEGDQVVVGRKDTGSYAVLPPDGAALLGRLADGDSPARAARWYEDTFGEPVDLDDFLDTLRELGFLRTGPAEAVRGDGRVPLRWLGRVVFSPPAWLGYLAVVGVWLVAVSRHPDLLPRPSHIFFTSSLLAVQLGITFGQLPLIFLHEAYHTLAGRRLGLRSRLSMSNRFAYVVFETAMNGLLSVPSRRRFLPFLSGMAADVVALCLLDLLAEATRQAPGGDFSLTGRIALALAFTVLMRIAWQFQFYLRTDIYYVIATALHCHDLHEASTGLLRNRIRRLLGRRDRMVDEGQWTERDRRVGRWYGPLVVLGIGVMIALTVFGAAPVIAQYFSIAARNLGTGQLDGSFLDASLSLAMNVGQVALAGYLAYRKRHPRGKSPLETVTE